MVATFLERNDPQLAVRTTTSPVDGLEVLAERDIDCVVSDYDMPECNGIEFLERVRADHPELPFILYTGKGSEEIASEAISAGVTDYLQKGGGSGQYVVLTNRIQNAVEQYQTRQSARATKEKFARIVEKTDEVLYMFSADWTELLFMNSAYEDEWGGSIRKISDDPMAFLEHIQPADRDRVRSFMETLSGGDRDDIEYRIVLEEGTRRWMREEATPIIDSDGDVSRIVGTIRDITAHKEREEQLRSSKARLEALFENSPDLIGIHDAEGRLRDVNRRFCDELGYEPEELVGKAVWDLDTTVEPSEARAFWTDLPTNSPRRFEGVLERKDGSTFPVEIHLMRLDLDGEDRFVAMDREITERKQREEDLVRQNERLNRFASAVSHDLRNPLQIAQGRLTVLRSEVESEQLDDIDYALHRMETLTDDLLTLARQGSSAISAEPVELAPLVERCWSAVETAAGTLIVETDRTVSADEDRLRQLFENLFANAVEHGGRDVTVTVGQTETGFFVADDGPGIPSAHRDDVFEPGYSTATDGTGFGLRIVEQVVQAHDWEISLADGPAGGALFEISNVESVDESD
ncbi:PAS domain S-box protein [Halostagnicola bangensis]